MLGRTLLFMGGGSLVVGGLAVIVANNVTFLFKHPRAPRARIIVDSQGARVDLESIKKEVANETGVHGLPRAAVPITDYDFGTMDPGTDGGYDFEIKNVGDAPLKLELGPTSCKCTISGLSADQLLPGESGKIRLEWYADRKLTNFSQTAVIITNDPTQRHIALGVTGKVKMLIGTDQQQVVIDRLEPNKSVTKEVLLYSQMWKQFEVVKCSSTLPGIAFAAQPVDPQAAGDLAAASVQRIAVTIPGTLPQGEFSDTLRFRVRPLDPEGPEQEVTLPLHGKVLRRLSLYGQGIREDGIVELGTVRYGAGTKVSLVMKVRDPQTELQVTNMQIEPKFLKASVTPHQEEGASGLYNLSIELPAGIEPCSYLGRPSGELKIDFDHPRIENLTLQVQFAVAP